MSQYASDWSAQHNAMQQSRPNRFSGPDGYQPSYHTNQGGMQGVHVGGSHPGPPPRGPGGSMPGQRMGGPGSQGKAPYPIPGSMPFDYSNAYQVGGGVGVVSAPAVVRERRKRLLPAEQAPPLPYRKKLYPPNTKVKNPQPPGADPSIPPSQTLYVNNINDRVDTNMLTKDIKRLFGEFGNIQSILALNSKWRRGQVWIVFETEDQAKEAMEKLQGKVYHNQALRINFSKQKSHFLIKKENPNFEPVKRKGPLVPKAIQERESKQKEMFAKMQAQFAQKIQAMGGLPLVSPGDMNMVNAAALNQMLMQTTPNMQTIMPNAAKQPSVPYMPPVVPQSTEFAPPIGGLPAMSSSQLSDKSSIVAQAQARAAERARALAAQMGNQLPAARLARFDSRVPGQGIQPQVHNTPLVPSNMLLVIDLPSSMNEEELKSLFAAFRGFKEARCIMAKRLAFIEYDSEPQATVAMQALQGHKIQDNVLKITYARK